MKAQEQSYAWQRPIFLPPPPLTQPLYYIHPCPPGMTDHAGEKAKIPALSVILWRSNVVSKAIVDSTELGPIWKIG